MGDNKKMYVPKEILDIYKNEIIHLTDILTPNEYELEWVNKIIIFINKYIFFIKLYIYFLYFFFFRLLTGINITTLDDINKALNILYAHGCKTVVVSSSNISSNSVMKCIGRNFSCKY